jgi:hypothetical protein
LCAVLTAGALGVAPISCKDDPKDAGDAADPGKADSPQAPAADDAADAAGADGDQADGGATKSGGIAQVALEAITGPRDITPHYPKDLDALLNLVPDGADTFIVVRDVGSLVDGTLGYADAQRASYEKLADEMAKEDPADAKEFREGLDKVREFSKTLAASGIDLSAGLVIADKRGTKDDTVIIYGSATANALPTMLTTLGAKGDLPDNCAPVAAFAGYAVCSEVSVSTYAPGSKASDLRKKMQDALPGVDLERANLVAHLHTDDGDDIPVIMETGQGMAHIAFAVPQVRADLTRYLEAGAAPGLGLIGAGQPFLWGRGSQSEITASIATAPPMAHAMIKTLTGEFVAGGLDGTKGLGVMIGLTDPAPASGFVSLASMGLGEVPKELPDGTKIEASVETLRGTQTLHAKFIGGKQEPIVKKIGYASELFAFAAGNYGAFTAGATEDVIDVVAKYKGTGPSADLLAALPMPLAKSIELGEPAFAMHMPFDALQSAQAAEMMTSLIDEIPPSPGAPADPKAIAALGIDTMAPFSSASLWLTHLDEGPVFHLAVQGFADVGTPEGAAALAAIKAVSGGADRKATYDALAKKFPSSPRAYSFRARAGDVGDAMASLVVPAIVLGGAGAFWFLGRAMSFGTKTETAKPPAVAVPEIE